MKNIMNALYKKDKKGFAVTTTKKNGDKYTKESLQELVDEALRMDDSDNPIFVVLEEEEVVTSG